MRGVQATFVGTTVRCGPSPEGNNATAAQIPPQRHLNHLTLLTAPRQGHTQITRWLGMEAGMASLRGIGGKVRGNAPA